jgi:hypothetical protein
VKKVVLLSLLFASSIAQADMLRLTCKMSGSVTVNGKVMNTIVNKTEVYSYRRNSLAKDGANHSIPALPATAEYLLFSENQPSAYQGLTSLDELLKGIDTVQGRSLIYDRHTNELVYIHNSGTYRHFKSGPCSTENVPVEN